MAAGPTYTPIATQTLGASASTVTFSSIPGTYTDLILICNTTGSVANQGIGLQFNSDTSTNYSHTVLYGDGSSAQGATATNQTRSVIGNISSTNPVYLAANIMNYKNTTPSKTIISLNGPSFAVTSYVSLWRASPAAISSMVLVLESGTFSSGSSFTLYGIAAA